MEPVETLAAIAGWFAGAMLAGYTVLSVLQLLAHIDRKAVRRITRRT